MGAGSPAPVAETHDRQDSRQIPEPIVRRVVRARIPGRRRGISTHFPFGIRLQAYADAVPFAKPFRRRDVESRARESGAKHESTASMPNGNRVQTRESLPSVAMALRSKFWGIRVICGIKLKETLINLPIVVRGH